MALGATVETMTLGPTAVSLVLRGGALWCVAGKVPEVRKQFTHLGQGGGDMGDMDVGFLLWDTGVIREEIDPVQVVGTAAAGRGRLGFRDGLVGHQGFGQEFAVLFSVLEAGGLTGDGRYRRRGHWGVEELEDQVLGEPGGLNWTRTLEVEPVETVNAIAELWGQKRLQLWHDGSRWSVSTRRSVEAGKSSNGRSRCDIIPPDNTVR